MRCLPAKDVERARRSAERLEALAARSGRRLLEARSALVNARLALAEGRPSAALEPARWALAAFGALGMPLEAADARLELARALAGELPQLALVEARAAHAAYKELGAARAMDAAAAVLRELGAGTSGGPQGVGELTSREREVLSLVARGMTNARIAEALFISEKTAGHHVEPDPLEARRPQPRRGGDARGQARRRPRIGLKIGNRTGRPPDVRSVPRLHTRRAMDHAFDDLEEAMTTVTVESLKHVHRATWNAGDYAAVAEAITDEFVPDHLLDRVSVEPGQAVLDVATGTGNVALRAAANADVTGLDLDARVVRDRAPTRPGMGRRGELGRGRRRGAAVRRRELRPRPVGLRCPVRAPSPACGRRALPRLQAGRHHRSRQLDAGGCDRRHARDHRPLLAAAAGVRLAAGALGQ